MPEKELCLNRLPVEYQPDAPAPTKWLEFLDGLLIPEDILTLQEYLGYLLIPSTKAQKMLVMTGKGGEGKSRIGLLLKKLFGEASHPNPSSASKRTALPVQIWSTSWSWSMTT